jgi:uncharacterized protein DUF2505
MRFEAEHRFHGTPGAVAGLLSDPDFYINLRLPDLAQPVLVEHRVNGSRAAMTLRYEFVGSLDPMARRLLGNSRLAWIQEISVDQSAGSGSLDFKAQADPKRLHGTADFRLLSQGVMTVRTLSGELKVAVPLIGPAAERKIIPGLLRRLDIEAEALDRRLLGEDQSR